jgi:radical SAM protein with 4Fe4S-binding SPASM domain
MRIRGRTLSEEAPAAGRLGIAMRDLAWIDGFYAGMRPHLFARKEDGVVILPPNRVYKANPSGIAVLKHLERGGKIAAFPGLRDGERAAQINGFFSDLRDFCAGNDGNMDSRPSVEMIPFDFTYTTLPILGEIAVTYRCNNSCLFCYASCGSRGSGGREMILPEIRRIIRIFKSDARIPFFSFTGGEPLLRKDLEKMISFAERLGVRTNLVTNGTLADPERAKSLYKSGLRTAQVSVESPDKDIHDLLASCPGSWEKTLAGIDNLRKAGISVQTNTTITAKNAPSAPRMPAFLKSLGVSRFSMNLYIPMRAGVDELFFPYSEIGPVIEDVRSAARAEGMTFYWYSPVPHCIYNPIAMGLGNKSCAAMDGLLSVSPEGDVLPCSSYPRPMGNLLRDGFRRIWFSEAARHFKNKEYAPAQCAGCAGFTACQSACPLYWERAGTREIRCPGSAVKEA